jgi:uncharacterized protein (UPF0332 family)
MSTSNTSDEQDFDWKGFLEVARVLSKEAGSAAQRTAISRAYYAVFGLARIRLSSQGFIPPTDGEAHSFVWKRFSGRKERVCVQIASIGTRLFRVRKQADYDASFPGLQKAAETAVADAEDFITKLEGSGKNCP